MYNNIKCSVVDDYVEDEYHFALANPGGAQFMKRVSLKLKFEETKLH